MEFVRPKKQRVWGWPTLINLILGGMASSFYLVKVLDVFLYCDTRVYSEPIAFRLLAPALVVVGFLPTAIKAGRPLSGLQLLRNIRGSWISREVLAAIVFIAAAVLDCVFAYQILMIFSITAAVALLVSQSFIVYRAGAITAWNMPLIPVVNLVSSLVTGYGLALFMSIFGYFPINRLLLGIAASFIALDAIIWLLYLFSSEDETFCKDTEVLRHPVFLVASLGVARLLPLLVLLILILLDVALVARIVSIVIASLGLVVIIGGAINKFGILLVAGYFKGLVFGRQNNKTLAHRIWANGTIQHSSGRCNLSN